MSVVDTYHAYIFGTSFWYATRGLARLTDPVRVSGWFRPPSQPTSKPSDLEIYTIWNDGWQLLTLALMLLIFTNAIPLPAALTGSQPDNQAAKARKPYARLAILVTIFHHITTCYGAYQHYSLPSHYTQAMGIGVWFNVFLTVTGVVALMFGLGDAQAVSKGKGKKRS